MVEEILSRHICSEEAFGIAYFDILPDGTNIMKAILDELSDYSIKYTRSITPDGKYYLYILRMGYNQSMSFFTIRNSDERKVSLYAE